MLAALLTDFGTADVYVGVMKAVMIGICPDARIVDLTHAIPPQDVVAGALALAAAAPYFPAGTIFLCVVDPGVGSARRAIAVRSAGLTFVAPDNGLVSLAVGEGGVEVVALENPAYALPVMSRTFEGRDRFAPAAAWLARGVDLATCGPRLDAFVRLDLPAAEESDGEIAGEVVRVDRFGNLVTNIPAAALARLSDGARVTVMVAGRTAPLVATYGEMPAGGLGALVGSTGHLEVSVNGGSAAATLGCGRGVRVRASRAA